MRALADWEAYIERLHPRRMVLGLERVARVLSRLPRPTAPPPVITVAGTNGKGSCVAYLEAVLGAAGYRTGAYTSPHLLRYNERVRIGGAEAPDALLCEAFQAVEGARRGEPLTYFEFGTLAALVAFWSRDAEVLLLEVGMGGRLDAVNVLDPDAAVVTGVDLDHTLWLGESREAIGREKAGIFRPGRPAVCGRDCPATVTDRARALGAPCFRLGREFGWREAGPGRWDWWGPGRVWPGLPPVGAGAHQRDNAACALMALAALDGVLAVDVPALRAGLARARLPGRCQVLPGRPRRILDVAHNPQAAGRLAEWLRAEPVAGTTHAVCAMLADKDHGGVLGRLAGQVDRWYLAGLASVARGAPAAVLREALARTGGARRVSVHEGVAEAWSAACAAAGPDDRIVAFGSFHTVGAIMAALSPPAAPPASR